MDCRSMQNHRWHGTAAASQGGRHDRWVRSRTPSRSVHRGLNETVVFVNFSRYFLDSLVQDRCLAYLLPPTSLPPATSGLAQSTAKMERGRNQRYQRKALHCVPKSITSVRRSAKIKATRNLTHPSPATEISSVNKPTWLL